MSIEVKVPVLPESVADATIATWHKKVGDRVVRDENMLDLETDKVVLEVPAPADGVVTACLFATGAKVNSGQILAQIEPGVAETPATPAAPVVSTEVPASGPAVRRLLAEHDIQPTSVVGSGKDGRITKDDVVSMIAPKQPTTPVVSASQVREERRVPMSRLRTKVAERLVQAQHEAAMLTTFNEVNLKAIMDLRSEYKDRFEKKHGVKLGFMS
ncbi:MAG: dihydrolipoamide succinyltransferase, partial [Legionella sp. 21-45-4]